MGLGEAGTPAGWFNESGIPKRMTSPQIASSCERGRRTRAAGKCRRCQVDESWRSRKPSSVRSRCERMVIYLRRQSPAAWSSLPTVQTVRAEPHRLFGLAPTGGYRATAVTSRAVGSYPAVSPLPVSGRFVFCGPVRRLAAPRRYLAICPVELGLSSTRRIRRVATINTPPNSCLVQR